MRTKAFVKKRGFTLVELLVVIGLIGLLAVALLTQTGKGVEAANVITCRTLILQLQAAARNYAAQGKYGDYPPDDFNPLRDRIQVKIDGINTGIESFLIYINRKGSMDEGFSDEEKFCNTDGDSNKSALGRYEHSQKYEVMDPWENPIAYFHRRNYRKTQTYQLGSGEDADGESFEVRAHRKPNGAFHNPRSFQIFSAGLDGEFNTADDIGNFLIPKDDEK